MRNTGQPSEKIFDDEWKKVGKYAYVFTFIDAAKATGLNRRKTMISAQPSDRILTHNGVTSYAEIKSTIDPECFRFSLLRTTQSAAAAFVVAAGGLYEVFIHSLATDTWFRVPYAVIKAAPQKHIKWPDLKEYEWTFPT